MQLLNDSLNGNFGDKRPPSVEPSGAPKCSKKFRRDDPKMGLPLLLENKVEPRPMEEDEDVEPIIVDDDHSMEYFTDEEDGLHPTCWIM